MAITYHIDPDRKRVTTILSGTVGLQEGLRHHEALGADPLFDPGFCEFMDGSAVGDIDLNSLAIWNMSQSCPFGPESKRAIYCGDNLLRYGLARSFQACTGGQHGEIQVFRDAGDAIKWLDEHTGMPSDARAPSHD